MDKSCVQAIERVVGIDIAYRIQEKLQYGILPKINYEGIVEYSSKMNDRFASSYYNPEGQYNQSQDSMSIDVRGSYTHYPSHSQSKATQESSQASLQKPNVYKWLDS